MGHDWIIDVLADLKTFARTNGMGALADHLDDTQLVAQVEIASQAKRMTSGLRGDDAFAGRHSAAVRLR
ncbi:hypothetical protein [Puniceibacterium sp. IMCC21224]|uniref:hypothetical protein n=1 Tax=Puniceibacterium sp. IMCC21224 TaxID=1618204 RepID=UPI00064DA21D|nr:hypothetical protein [Puniceibacterium sp. IMCC21224]KMK66051.1 hypothetical protein IMCC21224_11897 [Puniceibacterium sp. IMCC21224]